MLKYFITILVFFVALNILKADTLPELQAANLDSISFTVKVKALDLSEDGTPGATMNDEVFLFVYRQNGACLPQNIAAQFFILDTTKRVKTIKIKTPKILPTDTLTFIILEQDSNKQITGIEPVCRLYLNDIYENYQKNGTTGFFKYFDDDDVLGMYRIMGSKFDLSKPIIKKFESINMFDWAIYKLEISK